jgi:RecB family exonuclease
MERFLSQQTQLPPWLLARTRRALEKMLSAAESWISALPADRALSGSEVQLSVRVPPLAPEATAADRPATEGLAPDRAEVRPREVWLEGRADRLDRAADGSLIVVDFKTGATVPSKAAVAENAQLAVYQLAINLGAASGLLPGSAAQPLDRAPHLDGSPFGDEPPDFEPPPDDQVEPPEVAAAPHAGGAELVFLRSGTPNSRHQPPLDPASARAWQAMVREAAERLASSASLAQENRYCERCPVRSSCPLQPAGRQVTR